MKEIEVCELEDSENKEFSPQVSIVIPVYNGANYLREAIDSALRQDYPNVEVIVINDGSNDQGATEEIAKSYGSRIRYFYKENGGVATALNFGIEKMSGEYFSWLSHDDVYFKNKISKEVQALSELMDRKRVVCCGYHVVTAEGVFLYEVNPLEEYGKEKLEIPLFPVFQCCINGCALLIHKSHFERVGNFDVTLLTTQDYDLWFRILRGQSICFIGGPYFWSRSHEEQDSRKLYNQHIDECTNLWIRLFESLTGDEKCLMAENEFEFWYYRRRRFMKANYNKVVEYLDRKILEFLDNQADKKAILKILDDYEMKIEGEIKIKLQKYFINEENHYFLEYSKICNSTCWKLTKPLRWLLDVMRR